MLAASCAIDEYRDGVEGGGAEGVVEMGRGVELLFEDEEEVVGFF